MTNAQSKQIEIIKSQTIGVEVEMYGLTRNKAASTVAKLFGAGRAKHTGGNYDTWEAEDAQGRVWKFMHDSSIVAATRYQKCELVTPILTHDDLPLLRLVIEALKEAGAKSDPDHVCGIHVHVGASGQTAKSVRTLCNMMASHEDVLSEIVNITTARSIFCRKANNGFLEAMNKKQPETLGELKELWYGELAPGSNPNAHYNGSRYHMLNLHALFTKKTIEFRMFQFDNERMDDNGEVIRHGGLNADQLEAYVLLCMAMCAKAKTAKRGATATTRRSNVGNAKDRRDALRLWFERLCMLGDEFKVARMELVHRLGKQAA